MLEAKLEKEALPEHNSRMRKGEAVLLKLGKRHLKLPTNFLGLATRTRVERGTQVDWSGREQSS